MSVILEFPKAASGEISTEFKHHNPKPLAVLTAELKKLEHRSDPRGGPELQRPLTIWGSLLNRPDSGNFCIIL